MEEERSLIQRETLYGVLKKKKKKIKTHKDRKPSNGCEAGGGGGTTAGCGRLGAGWVEPWMSQTAQRKAGLAVCELCLHKPALFSNKGLHLFSLRTRRSEDGNKVRANLSYRETVPQNN